MKKNIKTCFLNFHKNIKHVFFIYAQESAQRPGGSNALVCPDAWFDAVLRRTAKRLSISQSIFFVEPGTN